MKKEVHPTYYPKAKITCACGNTFIIGSTKEKIDVEICYQCHPFYTGKEKLVDTAGRIEKFQRKMERRVLKPVKKPRKQSSKKSKKIA